MPAPSIKPSHKGLLHEDLGIPQDKPIPASALMTALHSKSAAVRRRANFARMAKRGWKALKKS
jgi:hypothetical protein